MDLLFVGRFLESERVFLLGTERMVYLNQCNCCFGPYQFRPDYVSSTAQNDHTVKVLQHRMISKLEFFNPEFYQY